MKIKYWFLIPLGMVLIILIGFWSFKTNDLNTDYQIGQRIDSLNGVYVYYNGPVGNVSARNTTPDGYNIGLEYQCVEFVKRYYYELLGHEMPNSYGHAKDFYKMALSDGQINRDRNLTQYTNPSHSKPAVNDLLVYDKTSFNKYGHVAIVSKVSGTQVEIIQQNPGPFSDSREVLSLARSGKKWKIRNDQILGWLRKK